MQKISAQKPRKIILSIYLVLSDMEYSLLPMPVSMLPLFIKLSQIMLC